MDSYIGEIFALVLGPWFKQLRKNIDFVYLAKIFSQEENVPLIVPHRIVSKLDPHRKWINLELQSGTRVFFNIYFIRGDAERVFR